MSDTVSGGRPASKLGQYSWAFFDWANQPYFTIVGVAVFAPYFATTFVGDAVRGQELWGYIGAAAGFSIALFSPIAGAIADAAGRRKPWLLAGSLGFFIGAMLLWFAYPGAPYGVWYIAAALVLAGVSMELNVVFNNAMLPDIAPANRIGYLSGFGYGIGYVGGFAALIGIFYAFIGPVEYDLSFLPDAPLWGIDGASHEHNRIVGPIAAFWYVIFVLPLFLFTPDRISRNLPAREAIRQGLTTFGKTLRMAGRYGNIVRFLVARMIYNDGLTAMYMFGGIYAAGIFGWSTAETSIFVLVLIVFAMIGAFVGGALDDKLGSKPTLYIAILLLLAGAVGSISIGPDTILFVIPVDPVNPDAPLTSVPELVYLFFGVLVGIGGGPTQSASRSFMARIAPKGMETEFFGLFAFSGKATVFLAPLLVAVVTSIYDSQRAGLVVVTVLLALGLLLLIPVRNERSEPLH